MSEQAVAVRSGGRLSVQDLTTTGMMIGIILLMSFTPLGYLRTAGLEVSLITIPVAIGAMIIGPRAGLLLGTVFGLTSFYQCFGMSPFGAALLGINPFLTFLVCVPTRAIMGWLTGMLFIAVEKLDRSKTICFFIGGIIAALLNTVLFMGALMLFFWNTEYIQSINAGVGNLSIFAFVLTFVGVNGLLEMPATCIVGGVVSKTLRKVLYKKIRSN
ncbi:ECF transporter S component [Anaerotignum sp.]|uniref:ECF transporter S component n=1 Tax=Anaerotignum sp. TaxID=2039241 RepID=UPI00289ACF60|nr:ECF transporter S component [Anaerotignum sp.]